MSRYAYDVSQPDYSYVRNREARIVEEKDGISRKLITSNQSTAEDFKKWLDESNPKGFKAEGGIEFDKKKNEWTVPYKIK
ncbi:MAG: hypothetical protein E7310_03925 [Clostridiales bacterium]|nr:hypothetical protein [Clostridiales bacterium]